jgi:hypothetical protein
VQVTIVTTARAETPLRIDLLGPLTEMPSLDLTDEDKVALIELLRETVDRSRRLLSPRVRRLRAILDKLDPPAPLSGWGKDASA